MKLSEAPYTHPGPNEIVIKNAAIAFNPYESIIQAAANLVVGWVKLPFILGTDVAGEVFEVGANVTRFKVGDRVLGHAVALDQSVNKSSEGGFQEYVVLRTNMSSKIPQSISYEQASVIPLGFSTSAVALYHKDYLGLPFPTLSPKPTRKTLLIWGGSTSVGCNAIQLAKASGFEVITTASPKNHKYLKELGANEVFDYNSPTVVPDIIAAFKNRTSAGAISIGIGSYDKCVDILSAVKGSKFISRATLDMGTFPTGTFAMFLFMVPVVFKMLYQTLRSNVKGISSLFLNGSLLVTNEVGKAVYQDFLPQALESGVFRPAPEPLVAGKGLERVQEVMDLQQKGVSANKLVLAL